MQHIFFATEINKMKELHYTDTIQYELEKTAKLMRKLALQLFEKLDIELSVDECTALDTISCNPDICQRDLSKLIIKDRANTGRIITALEDKELIERAIDTKNNRLVKKLNISQKGKDLLQKITYKIRDYMENVTTTISHEEVAKVRDILKVFRLNMEKVVEMKI